MTKDISKNFWDIKKVSSRFWSKVTSLSLDLWDHPTSLRVSNETVWQKTAMNLAELHSTKIDGIDQSGADTDMSLDIT